jgi:iron-sulfur cluster repair protein YtfE (RIC family)
MANHGVLSKLHQHHRAIARLIREIHERIDVGGNDHARLYQSLRRELLSHSSAEEHVLFAALATHDECTDDVRDGRDEHEEIEELLHELDRTDDDDEWVATFEELEDAVERHFREVETETFPLASRLLAEEELRRLAVAYQRERSRVQAVARGEEPDEAEELESDVDEEAAEETSRP